MPSSITSMIKELQHSVKGDVELTLPKIYNTVQDVLKGEIDTAKRDIVMNLNLHIKSIKEAISDSSEKNNNNSEQGGGRRKSRNKKVKKGKKGTRRR